MSVDADPTAWVEVDLGALRSNVSRLRQQVGDSSILAVVKAEAYGHGAEGVVPTLVAEGVEWVGVARLDEGLRLRRTARDVRVLVLGVIPPERIGECIDARLTPVVSSPSQLEAWSDAGTRRGETLEIHLKIDTGMHRLGLLEEEWGRAIQVLGRGTLRLAGILGHLSDAESPESERNREQEEAFDRALDRFGELGADRGIIRHVASSAAALHRPASRRDLVRAGLALYGIDPAGLEPGLSPALSLRARVVQVKTIAEGERVGYGGIWQAPRRSRIGIVPVGYADGYPWRAGRRAWALVENRRVKLIGAVSMDMLCIDMTDLDEASTGEGTAVTLIGTQGAETIGAVEVAGWAETSTYELLCRLALRLPRRYVDSTAAGSPPDESEDE